MTILETSPVPAGWYPDPQGSFQQRWWNGTSWTNEFAQYRPAFNYTSAVQQAVEQATPEQLQAAARVAAAQRAYAEAQATGTDSTESQSAQTLTLESETTRGESVQAEPFHLEPVEADNGPAQTFTLPESFQMPDEFLPQAPPVVAAPVVPVAAAPVVPVAAAPAVAAVAPAAPAVSPEPVVQQQPILAAQQPAPPAQLQPVEYTVIPQFPGALAAAAAPTLIPSTPTPAPQASGAANPTAFESYNPFGMSQQVRAGVRFRPVKRYTAAVFILAFIPALVVGGAIALATYLPESYTLFVQLALVALLVAVMVAFAMVDRSTLRNSGHESAAWAVLAAIPPLYFIVRTVIVSKETGARGSPIALVVAILVLAAIVAAFVLQPGLLGLVLTAY